MKIAVIGVGSIGSQVLRNLSKVSGIDVHGFEMAYPGHPNAAAGGESRLFRSFEFGDPDYQQIVVDKAPESWHRLEKEAGRSLLKRTGALIFGTEQSESLRELIETAKSSNRQFQILDSDALRRDYPGFKWKGGELGLWDPAGAIIRPELTVLTAARLAEENGAKIHRGVRVDHVQESGDHVSITVGNERMKFDRAVVASGGWTTQLIPSLRNRLVTRRLTSVWYQAKSESYLSQVVPFMRTSPGYCYGLPALDGQSVKIGLGFDDHLPVTNPDEVSRRPDPQEVQDDFRWVARDILPGLHPEPLRIDTYIESYSTTMRDYIAFQEDSDRLLVMAGFSGKGFKVSPVLGEIGAKALLTGSVEEKLGPGRDATQVQK